MECEQCGCVPTDTGAWDTCPFCEASYPVTQYVPTVIVPSRETALELRDLSTAVMQMLIDHPLSAISPEFKDVEQRIYQWMKEDAECYDELANRE